MTMVCLNHPDREAVYKCAACGKPVCEECAVEYDGDVYCSAECQERGSAAKERSAFIIDDTAVNNRKRRKKGFVFLVIIIIIAAAAYYYYSQNKEEINSKVSSHLEAVEDTVENAKKATLNTGHSTVPKDSKYRRQREGIVNQK